MAKGFPCHRKTSKISCNLFILTVITSEAK